MTSRLSIMLPGDVAAFVRTPGAPQFLTEVLRRRAAAQTILEVVRQHGFTLTDTGIAIAQARLTAAAAALDLDATRPDPDNGEHEQESTDDV